MPSDKRIFDVIVIGAGLGGLTCAAFLSRAGLRVLVLEKGQMIGGQCGSREVDGVRYIVGANGFGSHAQAVMRELGRPVEAIPSSSRMILEDADIVPPMGLFKERGKLGVSLLGIFGSLWRMGKAIKQLPAGVSTYQEAVDGVMKAKGLREMFYLFAWLVGAPPSALPAHHLQTALGKAYDYGNSWFPLHGSQAIPDALAEIVRASGGEIRTGQSVSAITVESGAASGVQVGSEWIPAARAVVSNAEIGQTLALLGEQMPRELAERTKQFRRALSAANLLLLADPDSPAFRSIPLTRGSPLSIVLSEHGMAEQLVALDEGRMPSRPTINLALGEAVARAEERGPRPISAIALWPRDCTSPEVEEHFVDETLERINRRFGEIRILRRELVTPARYEQRFGFGSCVAPVQESPSYEKPERALPIGKLYNVGTSVQPRATHAGSAIESGRLCAKEILAAAGLGSKAA